MDVLPLIDHALVVEDEYLIAVDVAEILKEIGCRRITMVRNAEEATRTIETERPDLITLDIRLGTTDCDALDRLLVERHIPFVYLSGFTAQEQPNFRGAPWVIKPAIKGELLAAICAVMPRSASKVRLMTDRTEMRQTSLGK